MKKPATRAGFFVLIPGDVLLSHTVARGVPSALEGLTTVFEMGTGVAPPVWSPGNLLRTGINFQLSVTAD